MLKLIKFKGLTGLKVFRLGRYQLELWYCPAGETIPWHKHLLCKSFLIHLLGKMSWQIANHNKLLGWFDIGWHYLVDKNTLHKAMTRGSLPALFANFEIWDRNVLPTSASVDFHTI